MTETPSTSAEPDDESTVATESPSAVESLFDPESLRDRDDITFTEATEVLDRETYETVREQSETDDGAALVGITNDDGEVLLKDTCTGWLAPGGNVEPDDDWTTVARREAESWMDVAVELDAVERVRRIDHRVAGDEPPDRIDDPFHVVFFRASLAPGETAPVDSPGSSVSGGGDSDESDDEDAPEVEWFDEVPEDVDQNHADDIRVFFD